MNVLACDLGGTRMKIGIVRSGRVLAETSEPSHSGQGLGPQLPVIKAAWLGMLAGLGQQPGDCKGISVSFPSILDSKTGRVLDQFGKFADAINLDLRAWAMAEFGLPLAIDNDARMALIGEWQLGAGKGCDNLVMMTLGTGLGACAVIEGKVLRGRHGQAGILGGHLTVRYGGRPCNCGNIGCAEAEASTLFLKRMIEETPALQGGELAKATELSFQTIFALAAAGDRAAATLKQHSLTVWGAAAVNLVHAYDPEMIILGGGIMGSADVILPAIQDYVVKHAHTPWGKVKVVPSALGAQAALLAGEWLLADQFPNIH